MGLELENSGNYILVYTYPLFIDGWLSIRKPRIYLVTQNKTVSRWIIYSHKYTTTNITKYWHKLTIITKRCTDKAWNIRNIRKTVTGFFKVVFISVKV